MGIKMSTENSDVILGMTADLVAAYVSNNSVPVGELPALIQSVNASLAGLVSAPKEEPAPAQKPAVNPKKSVFPDYIISLENGKRFKALKRHISANYGLTPEQYREKWNLPSNYPMVARNYAASRSALARSFGLGRKKQAEIAPKSPKSTGGAKRGRTAKVKAKT